MKHSSIFSFLLITLILTILLCACAEPAPETRPEEKKPGFTCNGIRICLNADAADVIGALGSPVSYTEEASCAFDGLDKTYCYGSFYLTTSPIDGVDRICRIWFADDGVLTDEGLRIGDTWEDARSLYGSQFFSEENTCILEKDGSRMTILFTDGLVSSIQYEVLWD